LTKDWPGDYFREDLPPASSQGLRLKLRLYYHLAAHQAELSNTYQQEFGRAAGAQKQNSYLKQLLAKR